MPSFFQQANKDDCAIVICGRARKMHDRRRRTGTIRLEEEGSRHVRRIHHGRSKLTQKEASYEYPVDMPAYGNFKQCLRNLAQSNTDANEEQDGLCAHTLKRTLWPHRQDTDPMSHGREQHQDLIEVYNQKGVDAVPRHGHNQVPQLEQEIDDPKRAQANSQAETTSTRPGNVCPVVTLRGDCWQNDQTTHRPTNRHTDRHTNPSTHNPSTHQPTSKHARQPNEPTDQPTNHLSMHSSANAPWDTLITMS